MIDMASYDGVPWIGLVLATVMAFIAAAIAWAVRWSDDQIGDLRMEHADNWPATFALLGATLVLGVLAIGPLAVPCVGGVFGVALVAFARRRDALVPSDQRLLSKHLLATVATSLRKATPRPAAKPSTAAGPQSLKDRYREFVAGLHKASARPKPAAGFAPRRESMFTFLKKDGTPVMAISTEGESEGTAVSENVRNAQKMFVAAIRAGATDVHFEPHEQRYYVRFRVDGVLIDADTAGQERGRGVISAIKVVADMNIAERRRPQDGTFAMKLDDDKFDVRVACTPTSYGEKMVLRLLQSTGGMLTSGLDSIGLRPALLTQVRDVIHKPYGMFLVAGPTGSGKTTTVYASLAEIDAHTHNITTIEDPVEYRLDGITQIAVNEQAEVSFANILRSVLRQDPDVLLVGEIRDRETAEIACQAALTGHFVFSTLHANDSVATITRLLDLGLDPMLIQTAVTAVLAQRLARKLCVKCRRATAIPEPLARRFKLDPNATRTVYEERGCPDCGTTGYRGRLGIHELLVMNDPIRALITAHPAITELKAEALRAGTKPLQSDGFRKVLDGITSYNEVMRVTT